MLELFGKNLINLLPGAIEKVTYQKKELTIYVHPSYITQVIFFLKMYINSKFQVLIDVCGADYPKNAARFEVIYHLLSINYNARIRVKASIAENMPIDSITSIFHSANWFERETWDMYGIFFSNHNDLRRILTDYGFEGHPLRKDFPLSGYTEVRYDAEKKRVVTEALELSQEYRAFDFTSPWENLINNNDK